LLALHLICRFHRRGTGRLRKAVALADPESGSVMETLLRVLHVVCGPEVESQVKIRAADGTFVARADLRLQETERAAAVRRPRRVRSVVRPQFCALPVRARSDQVTRRR
jgi:hypothetical protein